MIERRNVLKLGAAAAAATAVGATAASAAAPGKMWIVFDPADPIASSTPVARAVDQLRKALAERKVESVVSATADPASGDLVLILADRGSGHAEGFAIAPERFKGTRALRASSRGRLGLAYAVLELADRVRLSASPDLGLDIAAMDEKPANAVRSMARSFCSEIEDKGWYYDRAFWTDYLDMLVANRFNRVALFFGFGYDFPRNITDDYFQLPYVFLFDVPGHDVRLNPALPAGEREKNLETLKFISSEAAARGLHFQLGIWTHVYEWVESPKAFHRIEGLTPKTHAAYCRDALARLLTECPDINGVTFRIHVESGIKDGSFGFWKTLFEAFAAAGRPVEIDMHAKGITEEMIAIAQATGMPMQVSPKFSGEHMGLGYHQADIRENEVPTPARIAATGNSSSGVRRFTRYGYADLFVEGRKYGVLHRLWPGTQRFLLWGDPATAAAYSRAASFCESSGLEICEPLTFKGREASGHSGGRNAYRDKALEPGLNDWAKFEYEYRLWGRLLYNPDADRAGWGRYLTRRFGPAATAAEAALAHASRALPLFTTAHIPSTSNRYYWPEIYDNMPVMPLTGYKPIADLPDGYTLADISPLDPQLFSSIAEHAELVVAGKPNPKYSPAEVARALEGFAGMAETALRQARAKAPSGPAFRRLEEDVLIQVGLARFFAAKLQSGLLFQIYRKTGSTEIGRRALAIYARGRDIWVAMAERARGVYAPDISFGTEAIVQRGHWIDRVPDVDRDIAAMRAALANAAQQSARNDAPVVERILDPSRPHYAIEHSALDSFTPGGPLTVSLTAPSDVQRGTLYFRHVNHGERWRSRPMTGAGQRHSAEIPGDYTASPFPLQYYFLLQGTRGETLAPALGADWAGQPYYAVWHRRSA
ncbi:hypothetical protein IAG41_06355 [Sphingomonas sp. JC676]|uniref:hypothetical protein n=1 Tax=Sphingomonas sp. JC676 TaxID=2768065 RepID=UPI001657D1A4|nr:hypothetical protein [Sphingomonas sp. JC676]MBC9032008.1 hypothetical protein [Sphingomonas sp. JC676]